MNREYIRQGELVDTYGGDYTFRDTWYEVHDGKERFFFQDWGAKPSDVTEITDPKEIEELNWFAARYFPDGSRI